MRKIKIWFIGDIFGRPGRNILFNHYKNIVENRKIDFTIINGENAAGGLGITPQIADEFFKLGIDVITSGNHIWSKKEIYPYLNNHNCLLRPANYPDGTPGSGIVTINKFQHKITVVNLLGKVFIPEGDCPFRKFDALFEKIRNSSKIVIVDLHAEATSEKIAFAYYAACRASAVIGTHTHVQTNDCRIIDNHTAFITDAGMTGPYDNSIIGVDKDIILKKFLTSMPQKFETAKSKKNQLNSVVININVESGAAENIEHLNIIEQA